jgi:hypothetical protein
MSDPSGRLAAQPSAKTRLTRAALDASLEIKRSNIEFLQRVSSPKELVRPNNSPLASSMIGV